VGIAVVRKNRREKVMEIFCGKRRGMSVTNDWARAGETRKEHDLVPLKLLDGGSSAGRYGDREAQARCGWSSACELNVWSCSNKARMQRITAIDDEE
jgi:hypothetical protein